MAALPPSLLADLERELARVDGLLDRCAGRLSAIAVMAGFPDAGNEAGPSAALPSPRLPPPPMPRRNLPPED